MRYQYKREPLTGDEATRLAKCLQPHATGAAVNPQLVLQDG